MNDKIEQGSFIMEDQRKQREGMLSAIKSLEEREDMLEREVTLRVEKVQAMQEMEREQGKQ